MRKLLLILLAAAILLTIGGCAKTEPPAVPDTREITDRAGREVSVPAVVGKGMGINAMGVYMLYTMEPGTLIGVSYEFNEAELAYILPEYRNLTAYGQNTGLNLEALVAAAPDVLISYGSLTDAEIADIEALQTQTGIPCIMLSASMSEIPAAYRLLGEVFDKQARCEELAGYAQRALDFAANLDVPEPPVTVYYGNGAENLETAPTGSPGAELFKIVGAENVVLIMDDISARVTISPEHLLTWDPQVVILNGEPKENISPSDAVDAFLSDLRYADLQAVQSGKVYAIPKYPYSWFDRPNGPNRLIGIYWLSDLLYSEQAGIDIKKETRAFYSLFYHMELTDVQLTELLRF